jgi:hypothetical protein
LLVVGLSAANAVPTLSLTASAKAAPANTPVTLTLSASCGASDVGSYTNLRIKFTPPTGWTLSSATAPKTVSNQAELFWDGGSSLSNLATLRLTGQTVAVSVTGNTMDAPIGNLGANDSAVVTAVVSWQ